MEVIFLILPEAKYFIRMLMESSRRNATLLLKSVPVFGQGSAQL